MNKLKKKICCKKTQEKVRFTTKVNKMNCFEFSKYIAEQILEESDAVVKYEQFLGMVKSEIHFMEQRLKEDAILKSEKEDKEAGRRR